MQILQVICFASFGGAEKNTFLVTQSLARRGHRCWLAFPPGPYGARFRELEALGVTCLELDFRGHPWQSALRLRALIREQGIDLVHSHMYLADFLVFLAAFGLPRVARISTLHLSIAQQGEVARWRRAQQRLFTCIAFTAFARVFSVSESLRRESIPYFRLAPGKVVTCLNSIDFRSMAVDPHKRARLTEKFGLETKAFRICAVGSFHVLKSQITLIQALGLHLADQKDIEIFLIGDGDFRERLRSEAERLGLAARVRFTGVQQDMNEWYSCMDMFVHTSFTEALSRSILEAMYMGVPVIASDIPSTGEIIRDGETGLLFPPGDAKALAERIRRLRSEPATAERFRAAARDFVTTHCGIDAMTDAMLAHTFPGGIGAAAPSAAPNAGGTPA
jgi:L-malate glycosyltransferase